MPVSRVTWIVATYHDVVTLLSDSSDSSGSLWSARADGNIGIIDSLRNQPHQNWNFPTFVTFFWLHGVFGISLLNWPINNLMKLVDFFRYLVELGADRSNIVRMGGGINAWKRQCGTWDLGPATMVPVIQISMGLIGEQICCFFWGSNDSEQAWNFHFLKKSPQHHDHDMDFVGGMLSLSIWVINLT